MLPIEQVTILRVNGIRLRDLERERQCARPKRSAISASRGISVRLLTISTDRVEDRLSLAVSSSAAGLEARSRLRTTRVIGP